MEVYKQAFKLQKDLDKKLEAILRLGDSKAGQSKLVNDIIKIIGTMPDADSNVAKNVGESIAKAYKNQGFIMNDFVTGQRFDNAIVDFYNTMLRQLPREAIRNLTELNTQVADLVAKGSLTEKQAVDLIVNSSNYSGFTLVDSSGRKRTLANTVKTMIRGQLKNAARMASEDIANVLGTNVYEISSHGGARPLCALDQGKLFSDTGGVFVDLNGNKRVVLPWSSSTQGNPAGLFGINCRHIKYPLVPGFSVPSSQDPLKEQAVQINDTETQILT